MRFSLKLNELICHEILSTPSSNWGAADGIRLYFLAVPSGNPDLATVKVSKAVAHPHFFEDNFRCVPGTRYDLGANPPLGAPDWELGPFDLAHDDAVAVAIIGVNEGLPWIGGGGGPSPVGHADVKVFEKVAEEMAKEGGKEVVQHFGEAAGNAGFAFAWNLVEALAEKVNHATDCRGVAFLYELTFSMKYLLHRHLGPAKSELRLSASQTPSALSLVATQHRPGCGSPHYEIGLGISRVDDLSMAVDDVETARREGDRTMVPVLYEDCQPAGHEIPFQWPVFTDRTITVVPSVFPSGLSPTWYLDGVELQRHAGTVTLQKLGDARVGDEPSLHPVTIAYERLTSQGVERLVLRTRGEDGNYPVDVSLRLNFEGTRAHGDEWAPVLSEVVRVQGKQIAGNDAYARYMRCVTMKQVEQKLRTKLLQRKLEKPLPDEVEQIRREIHATVLSGLLREHARG